MTDSPTTPLPHIWMQPMLLEPSRLTCGVCVREDQPLTLPPAPRLPATRPSVKWPFSSTLFGQSATGRMQMSSISPHETWLGSLSANSFSGLIVSQSPVSDAYHAVV